jgi:hypothetical protein
MTAGSRPAPPPSPHPHLDTLADLDAGVLEGAEADRVRAHVAGCARCEQAVAAFEGVRADLRALPAPPMPAVVAARLDSALADLRTAATPSRPVAAATRAPAPVADLDAVRERRRRRLSAAAMAVAAAFVLVVAGFSVTSLVRSGGNATDSSAGGGGSALEPGAAEQKDSAGAAPDPAASDPALPAYTSATLRAHLAELEQESTALSSAGAGERSVLSGAMADSALRTACAETIPGHRGTLRVVRWIRYEGQPAYVFVFGEAGRRTAYVVGDQCGRTPAVPATVLDTVR